MTQLVVFLRNLVHNVSQSLALVRMVRGRKMYTEDLYHELLSKVVKNDDIPLKNHILTNESVNLVNEKVLDHCELVIKTEVKKEKPSCKCSCCEQKLFNTSHVHDLRPSLPSDPVVLDLSRPGCGPGSFPTRLEALGS